MRPVLQRNLNHVGAAWSRPDTVRHRCSSAQGLWDVLAAVTAATKNFHRMVSSSNRLSLPEVC